MSLQKQSGAVFLLFITVMVLAGVVLTIGKVSINQQRQNLTEQTHQRLQLAKDALLGYALNQDPPGVLPCPDVSGDGDADISGGVCSVMKGWLPFRTLAVDDLRDSSGEKFWYVLDTNYAQSTSGFNSSFASQLNTNGTSLAFALIAPYQTLTGQVRSSSTPDANNYLEGVNSDTDPFTVAYEKSDDNNDILLNVTTQQFWAVIERGVVLPTLSDALNQYLTNCGVYPWAANFSQSPFDSMVSLQQGSVPTNSQTPSDGSVCASNLTLPAWFESHWASQVQYQFCLQTEGQCITVTGDTSDIASAVLIAPGTALVGQNRSSHLLSDYFENENSNASAIVELRQLNNHESSFNDVSVYQP